MISGYAIIPDGQNAPSALFIDLEDAVDWGLSTTPFKVILTPSTPM
jgi:hypothetical protein